MERKIKTERDHTHRLVLKYAAASRLLMLVLIVLWRSLLSPYDTSASIDPPCLAYSGAGAGNSSSQVLLPRVAAALESSIVWDSVYFVRIARCGYEYEQSYAFFPLLPICISFLSGTVFAPLVPIIGQRAVLGLSGYVLNNIAFAFAAFYLYKLSVMILNDQEIALRASILFCFNPASIFYSSIYSESLYALLSVGGVYYLFGGRDNIATLCFTLSGAARSNGMLNAGYIGFITMRRAYDAIFLKKRAFLALQVVVLGAFRCFCIFSPFVSFQAYGYLNICRGHAEDDMSPWCSARIPLLYDYIQSRYWGVGFLRYFQVKQLPNFLLASPILSLAVCSILHFVKLGSAVFLSLGVRDPPSSEELSASVISADAHSLRLRKRLVEGWNIARNGALESYNIASEGDGILPVIVLPFVLHLGFMAATAFLVMHVQVATRFLSASPLLYWFASYIMITPDIGRRWGYFIWGYCASYIFLGSLLFSNFYPFT